MNLVLDRLLWVPKKDRLALLPHLRSELTVVPSSDFEEGKPLTVMEEGEDWIGVPREWGMRQQWLTRGEMIEDRTVLPTIDWPKFEGKFRQGQQQSVDTIVESFRKGKYGALLEAKTGTGKTVIATVIASMMQTPTLVVVHKEDLAHQWQQLLMGGQKEGKWIEPLFPGGRVGHVQGNVWKYVDCHLTTAMAQTLYRRMGREPEGFYRKFGLVIFDEGHRYPARTFEAVMRLPQARHRLAVSATWRRRDGLECIWNWHVGRVEHRTAGLHMLGEYVQVPWNTNVQDAMFRLRGRVNHARYLTAIARNVPYNEWLTEELIKGAKAGRQVLLCSHRTDQLSEIRKRVLKKGEGVSVGYYAGKVDGREIKTEELEETKKAQIVLATFAKMSEGTDIATLDTLFLATPASDVEQVVGRIQRPKTGKRSLLVVDPVWVTPYNRGMALKRLRVYEKLGFTRQIGVSK